jgi:hypothetical protein
VVLKWSMLGPLVRLVRVIHMTIGISEPKPGEERIIALVWLAVFVLLAGVFVVGLFVIG